jgi:hypothetical protein
MFEDEKIGNKLNAFKKDKEIVFIETNKILLVEPIHLSSTCDFSKQVERLKTKGINNIDTPIIVRGLEGDKFALVVGFKTFEISKQLEQKLVPAIIVKQNRGSFLKKMGYNKKTENVDCYLPISKIVVPYKFLNSVPSKEKYEKHKKAIEKNNGLNKSVTLQGNKIVDGYISYLIAKEKGYTSIPVKFVEYRSKAKPDIDTDIKGGEGYQNIFRHFVEKFFWGY